MPIEARARRPIRRCHTGCKSCRLRGKKCDETKPTCKACVRLSLPCSYAREIVFQDQSAGLPQEKSCIVANTNIPDDICSKQLVLKHRKYSAFSSSPCLQKTQPPLVSRINIQPYTAEDVEASYFAHFELWIRRDLLRGSNELFEGVLKSPLAKYGVLCLSASHMAVLDGRPSSCTRRHKSKYSLQGTDLHVGHYKISLLYLAKVGNQLSVTKPYGDDDIMAILFAKVLLAHYHHAITDHKRFRLAVLDSFRFVQRHYSIFTCTKARPILQFWYRLWTSSRLSKPPSLPIEGEIQAQSQMATELLDVDDQIQSVCNIGLSSDDLIHNILIKMMELRSRVLLNKCAAHVYGVSPSHSNINELAQHLLDQQMRSKKDNLCRWDEKDGARTIGFVSGEHLIELMKIQREKLRVWKSTLRSSRIPAECRKSQKPNHTQLRDHRDAMNNLYYLLCSMMFVDVLRHFKVDMTIDCVESADSMTKLLESFYQVIDNLDYSQSNLRDVYGYSLCEVLRYFAYVHRSEESFHHILNVIWPRIERHGKGFEHSHLPTHLAKRLIEYMAIEHSFGRDVILTFNAMPEHTAKSVMLDLGADIVIVACVHDVNGAFSLDKQVL